MFSKPKTASDLSGSENSVSRRFDFLAASCSKTSIRNWLRPATFPGVTKTAYSWPLIRNMWKAFSAFPFRSHASVASVNRPTSSRL